MITPLVTAPPIRVLVVDDSALTRRIIATMLSSDPQIIVVGEAQNGREAMELTATLQPDIITMDVWMPHVDGLQATEHIMAYTPTPILVLTASLSRHDSTLTFQMLNAGALEVLEKPKDLASAQSGQLRAFLLERVKILARVTVVTHLRGRRRTRETAPLTLVGKPPAIPPTIPRVPSRLVIIGASTGGPRVIYALLRQLPADFPAAIVIVQHIAAGFVETMVDWFRTSSPLRIALAQDGDTLRAGTVLVAPETSHLVVDDCWHVGLQIEPQKLQHPSIDVALQSAAQHCAKQTIGVVLTGMGRDGASGLLALRNAGGTTLVQNQASSAIWGMPRVAAEMGAAMETVAADDLATRLQTLIQERRGGA